MKKLFFALAFVLITGAGCNTNSMTQSIDAQSTILGETEAEQIVSFALNKDPYTGGPAYRMFDVKTGGEKTVNGSMITFSFEDFQKVEEKGNEVENETAPSYRVTAKIKLSKVTDENTSVPGAPEVTYYEARIIELFDVQ